MADMGQQPSPLPGRPGEDRGPSEQAVQPSPRRSPAGRLTREQLVRLWLPPAVLAVSGALAIAGTFPALLHLRLRAGPLPGTPEIAISAWQETLRGSGQAGSAMFGQSPLLGIPLVVGGALTLGCAVLLALGLAGRFRFVRPLLAGSVGLTIGAVWATGMYVASVASQARGAGVVQLSVSTGSGMWLLVTAAALGVIGTTLALLVWQAASLGLLRRAAAPSSQPLQQPPEPPATS